jgi:hypothetical protein
VTHDTQIERNRTVLEAQNAKRGLELNAQEMEAQCLELEMWKARVAEKITSAS